MRAVTGGLVLALGACSAVPRGTASVIVYGNGTHDSEVVGPPEPQQGATVFEDGGDSVVTDANGEATLSVFSEPATIHVVENSRVTTVIGVPDGGVVRLGKRPYFRSVGVLGLLLTDVGAPSYSVYGPAACLSLQNTGPSPQLGGSVNTSCVGQTVRLYGEAFATTGAQITEQSVAATPNFNIALGSYVDVTSRAITATNLPPLPAAPTLAVGAVDPTTGFAIMLATTDGPADADLVQVTSTGDATSSRLLVQGPVPGGTTTLDASHMLPVPDVVALHAEDAEWSIAPSAATPNLIELQVVYSNVVWTVYAPATTTRAVFPRLPASLDGDEPSGGTFSNTLAYYELPRTGALTLDELAGAWDGQTSGLRVDHQPIAVSEREF